MEIIRTKHEGEMHAVSVAERPSMMKKHEELRTEIYKWLDAKFLEMSVNEAIRAKMLAKLSFGRLEDRG